MPSRSARSSRPQSSYIMGQDLGMAGFRAWVFFSVKWTQRTGRRLRGGHGHRRALTEVSAGPPAPGGPPTAEDTRARGGGTFAAVMGRTRHSGWTTKALVPTLLPFPRARGASWTLRPSTKCRHTGGTKKQWSNPGSPAPAGAAISETPPPLGDHWSLSWALIGQHCVRSHGEGVSG